MGACILCGKSAGLFYSLHKECFNKYDSSNQHIANLIESGLGRQSTQNISEQIEQHIKSHSFTGEASSRTLNRALEFYAKNHLNKNQLKDINITAWLELLEHLSPDESLFINANFVVQQQNLPAVSALNENLFPEKNCNPANFSIELNSTEQLWWCFEGAYIEQSQPNKSGRQWSIVMQIFEGLLPKKKQKQKKALQTERSNTGKLLLTSQRIQFEGGSESSGVRHRDIYSCTPVPGGVKIQSTEPKSLPKTYACEDGRLLYLFIKKASELDEG